MYIWEECVCDRSFSAIQFVTEKTLQSCVMWLCTACSNFVLSRVRACFSQAYKYSHTTNLQPASLSYSLTPTIHSHPCPHDVTHMLCAATTP